MLNTFILPSQDGQSPRSRVFSRSSGRNSQLATPSLTGGTTHHWFSLLEVTNAAFEINSGNRCRLFDLLASQNRVPTRVWNSGVSTEILHFPGATHPDEIGNAEGIHAFIPALPWIDYGTRAFGTAAVYSSYRQVQLLTITS